MKREIVVSAAVIALGSCLLGTLARADGPEVGVNAGVAVPVKKYSHTVEGVGGTVGLSGGYRFDLTDTLALSFLANPQFVFAGTEEGCCPDKRRDDDIGSIFSITGGPKLSLLTGMVETYASGQGGYYRDMSGPLSVDGVGYNLGAGVNVEVARATRVGVFGRYDVAYMSPEPGTNADQRKWASGGLALQYAFLPEERVAQAPPPPPPAPPPPPPTRRRIVLRGVNFDFDKSNIRPDARPILDEAIATLRDEPDIRISVEGHTDAIGTDAYNQKLSERRALAVADYLAHGGIARSRMTSEGFGESKPVANNATADGRAQNRRVELRILGQ
jgi:outer membrane protein OmpA-like peptidoglycan-associated protein